MMFYIMFCKYLMSHKRIIFRKKVPNLKNNHAKPNVLKHTMCAPSDIAYSHLPTKARIRKHTKGLVQTYRNYRILYNKLQ